jgi:hypothetical protein
MYPVGCTDTALLPQGGPSVLNAPCIAADPRDEQIVYMVFLGRTNSANGGANIDLFIARSDDGGANFSYDDETVPQPGKRVLHLRDEDLGDPEQSLQFLPSIAVDAWGGVHVLYYVGWKVTVGEAVEWRYQVKMVSLEQFRVFPHPTNSPNVLSKLNVHPQNSQHYFTLDHSLVKLNKLCEVPTGWKDVGDYNHGIVARWCEIYAGFIAPALSGSTYDGEPRAMVSRIVLDAGRCTENPNCYANCDGSTISPILNINDYVCFLQRFAIGCDNPQDCYANCDESTTEPFLNVSDFSCFLQKFSAGCN